MRLVFAGTPQVAVPALDALLAGAHEVTAVITREDAPLGRKRVLTPSPVAARAAAAGVPVIKSNRLDDATTDRVTALQPDLGVVVAYGGLLRERLLETPGHGWINLHFSLLPRWRGAAPVQRALIAGDRVTGAAVFRLVERLDAGDVYAAIEHPVGAEDTAGDVLAALAESGAALLAATVVDIADGTATATPQTGEPTLAPKLTIDDGKLDWERPAAAVHDRFRGVTPEPGAFATLGENRVKILGLRRAGEPGPDALPPGGVAVAGRRILVGTATEPLELVTVQPAGKRAMPAADWLRGLAGEVTFA